MGERLCYTCRLRLDDAPLFVIWYSDERDGFVRDEEGRLRIAGTLEGLAALARGAGIALEDQGPADYDFDRIRAWCDHPGEAGIDCPAFLNAWNFFDDLANLHTEPDSPYSRLSRAAEDSYDTLFWGCNLPAMTPPGERFDPTWTPENVAEIREVLEAGLRRLAAELRDAADRPASHPDPATPGDA